MDKQTPLPPFSASLLLELNNIGNRAGLYKDVKSKEIVEVKK